jgi:hypothetical protein
MKNKSKKKLLDTLSFGERIAEQEANDLSSYFVETKQWQQLFSGEIDIIYGPKGAGKSALYSLLASKEQELFDRQIIIVRAENPTGTTAFAGIKVSPPTSEYEFTGLWKLYFVCLIAKELRNHDVNNDEAKEIYANLEEANLLQIKSPLRTILLAARDYSKRIVNAESSELGLEIDPATGMLTSVRGKITFREPNYDQQQAGLISIDALLEKTNLALSKENMTAWILLDRLDVAFEQADELEHNALRALFRAYLDMMPSKNICLKVFLRTDIWRRITDKGFSEASHITRHLTITWRRQSLLNLVVRRLLANESICEYYNIKPADILSSVPAQEALIKRIFPDQIATGKNPATFDWMLSRTQDGTKLTAPRELIHLLSRLREVQTERLELGHDEPANELIFDRATFKEALKSVSEERLTKTLYAENNELKIYIEKLGGEKTQQNPETLGTIWGLESSKARGIADELVRIGFFENRGSKHEPVYWVPFLYRDALGMVQGEAR